MDFHHFGKVVGGGADHVGWNMTSENLIWHNKVKLGVVGPPLLNTVHGIIWHRIEDLCDA